MNDRNEFLEMGGLVFETDTHEWFNDKPITNYARENSIAANGRDMKDKLDIVGFVVRDKQNGEYDRVLVNKKTNEPIYDSKSMEDILGYIDRLKILKRFKNT